MRFIPLSALPLVTKSYKDIFTHLSCWVVFSISTNPVFFLLFLFLFLFLVVVCEWTFVTVFRLTQHFHTNVLVSLGICIVSEILRLFIYNTKTGFPLFFGSVTNATSGTSHFSSSNTSSWKRKQQECYTLTPEQKHCMRVVLSIACEVIHQSVETLAPGHSEELGGGGGEGEANAEMFPLLATCLPQDSIIFNNTCQFTGVKK